MSAPSNCRGADVDRPPIGSDHRLILIPSAAGPRRSPHPTVRILIPGAEPQASSQVFDGTRGLGESLGDVDGPHVDAMRPALKRRVDTRARGGTTITCLIIATARV